MKNRVALLFLYTRFPGLVVGLWPQCGYRPTSTPMATEETQNSESRASNSVHGFEGTRLAVHADTLKRLVHLSSTNHDVTQTIHSRIATLENVTWPKWLESWLEKMAAKRHWGNFVAVRGQDRKIFESMSLYAR